jgi:hypothetical protein
MMNVGSMSGAGSVGGMKGVAAGVGEQAEARRRIKITAGRLWLGKMRYVIIKKKGDPLPSRPTGNLCFFV